MIRIRFDLDLQEDDIEALDIAMKKYHRSRKNICEAVVMLAINEFKNFKGTGFVDLRKLGEIKESK